MGICGSKPVDPPVGKIQNTGEHVEQSAENGAKPATQPSETPLENTQSVELDYKPPGKPTSEKERLQLLRALNILDTEQEGRFNAITSLMSTVFHVPIAAVSLRQWFKAAEGLGEVCQTGRDVSFCGHTILPAVPQIMIVEDTLEDVRFSGNPLVLNPPHIRFYAGAPLVSSANGYRYGSLCIIDLEPHRNFSSELYNMLAQFSELVVREIEKDKLALLQKMVSEQRSMSMSGTATPLGSARSSTLSDGGGFVGGEREWGLSRAADCFVEGVMLLDMATPNWAVLYTNAAFTTSLVIPKDEAVSQGFWDLFSGPGLGPDACLFAIEGNEPFSLTIQLQSIYRQTPKFVTVDFRPAASAQLGVVGQPPGVPGLRMSPSSTTTAPLVFPNAPLPRSDNPVYYFAIVQPESLRDKTPNKGSSIPSVGGQTSPLAAASGGISRPEVPAVTKSMPTAFTDVRLGPLIGRGAYGRVYRGSWNGNTVAVKVMETSERLVSPDGSDAARNQNEDKSVHGARGLFEAILSSALSHPNVVHTYQYAVRPLTRGSTDGGGGGRGGSRSGGRILSEVWIISEFCNRGPLLTAIERGAFLTQPSAQYGQPNLIAVLQTLQEVAAAMQYLHSHDIVHGDLTGGNVLLTASDKDARGFSAKVVDFGLSRVCGEDAVLKTKTMGCAEYMPPELITGGILTKASDVYAFGVILWEIYLGKRAWEGLQPAAVLKKVASNEMLSFPAQTPHRLKLLGEKCMVYEPTKRPSFVEVLSEVNAILGDTMNILQQFLQATASNGASPSPS